MRVTFQLLDYDRKRCTTFQQLFHAEHGWVAATSENMSLHVDMAARKTAAFPGRGDAPARPDEGLARAPAAARGRRPPDRDAGEEASRESVQIAAAVVPS